MMNQPLVRINPVATALYGPPGSGKSQGVILPWLAENNVSACVVDFKGELAKESFRLRKKMGHRVVLLDPFKVVTQTPDSFNPFDAIPKDDASLIDACRDLAEALVIRTGQEKEPFWNDSAQFIIQAVCCFVAHFAPPDGSRSLQMVRTIISHPQMLNQASAALQASTEFGGLLARMGNQMLNFQDKEKSSVISTVNRFLSFLDSPALQDESSTFDPADLKRGNRKMTCFLILPVVHARAQSALLRMWISSLLRSVVSQGLDESRKVWFILDEAAAIGHMGCLDDLLERYRGYGCRSVWALQSRGALPLLFPEGRHVTFESVTTSIYMATADLETATHISNKLGEHTLITESGGSSTGWQHSRGSTSGQQPSTNQGTNTSGGSSSNWSMMARKLLKPEEVLNLDPCLAITFTPGYRPILTRTVQWWRDKRLLRPSLFGGFTASCKALFKAFVWMVVGILAAYLATAFALQREAYQPPVYPAYYGR
jgi:type IV secretion system protein VirD4